MKMNHNNNNPFNLRKRYQAMYDIYIKSMPRSISLNLNRAL